MAAKGQMTWKYKESTQFYLRRQKYDQLED